MSTNELVKFSVFDWFGSLLSSIITAESISLVSNGMKNNVLEITISKNIQMTSNEKWQKIPSDSSSVVSFGSMWLSFALEPINGSLWLWFDEISSVPRSVLISRGDLWLGLSDVGDDDGCIATIFWGGFSCCLGKNNAAAGCCTVQLLVACVIDCFASDPRSDRTFSVALLFVLFSSYCWLPDWSCNCKRDRKTSFSRSKRAIISLFFCPFLRNSQFVISS